MFYIRREMHSKSPKQTHSLGLSPGIVGHGYEQSRDRLQLLSGPTLKQDDINITVRRIEKTN